MHRESLPPAPEDDLPVRDAGPYVLDKLGVLNAYLWEFAKAGNGQGTGRSPSKWWYIDASAGPGVNRLKTDGTRLAGSPIIAMAVNDPPVYPAAAGLVFADNDPKAVTVLRQRTSHDERARVLLADVHSDPEAVLSTVPRNAPAFAFFDPTGLECSWSTLEFFSRWRTVGRYKMELLVMLPVWVGMLRTLFKDRAIPDSFHRSWGEMFGPLAWSDWFREDYQSSRLTPEERKAAIDRLTRMYEGGFKSHLGYASVQRRLVPDHGQPRYWLIFASDHPAGDRIMKSVMDNRYAPQQSLFKTDPGPYR